MGTCTLPIPPNKPKDYIWNLVSEHAELAFTSIFTVELLIKVTATGLYRAEDAYLRSRWNWLDASVVVLGWITYLPGASSYTGVRALRLLRVLRAVRSNKKLQILVDTLLDSAKPLLNVFALWMFFMLMFSLLGMQLWVGSFRYHCVGPDGFILPGRENEVCRVSEDCEPGQRCTNQGPDGHLFSNPNFGLTSFDNLPLAFLAIFQALTLEGWSYINSMTNAASAVPLAILFWLTIIIFGAYFLMNLPVAILFTYYSQAELDERTRQRMLQGPSPGGTVASMTASKPRGGMHRPSRRRRISQSISMWAPVMYLRIRASRISTILSHKASLLDCGLNPWLRSSRIVAAARRFVDSRRFLALMFVIILGNAVVLAVDHHGISARADHMLDVLNNVFTGLFIAEMAIKLLGRGARAYVASKGNLFDLVLIVLSVVELTLSGAGGWNVLRLLRLLRVLRLLKLLHIWPSFQEFLRVMLSSLASIGNFLYILMLVLLIYALLGVQLLGTKLACHNSGRCTDPAVTEKPACVGSFLMVANASMYMANASMYMVANASMYSPIEGLQASGNNENGYDNETINNNGNHLNNATAYWGHDKMGATLPDFPWLTGSLYGVPEDPYVYHRRVWGCDSFPRTSFRNFYWALLSVFQLLTAENWNVMLYTATHATSPWVSLYFISFIIIGNLVMLNLLLAALAHNVVTADARRRRGLSADDDLDSLMSPVAGSSSVRSADFTSESHGSSLLITRDCSSVAVKGGGMRRASVSEGEFKRYDNSVAVVSEDKNRKPQRRTSDPGTPLTDTETLACSRDAGMPAPEPKPSRGKTGRTRGLLGHVPLGLGSMLAPPLGSYFKGGGGRVTPPPASLRRQGSEPSMSGRRGGKPQVVPPHLRRWVGIQILREKASLPPNPMDDLRDHRHDTISTTHPRHHHHHHHHASSLAGPGRHSRHHHRHRRRSRQASGSNDYPGERVGERQDSGGGETGHPFMEGSAYRGDKGAVLPTLFQTGGATRTYPATAYSASRVSLLPEQQQQPQAQPQEPRQHQQPGDHRAPWHDLELAVRAYSAAHGVGVAATDPSRHLSPHGHPANHTWPYNQSIAPNLSAAPQDLLAAPNLPAGLLAAPQGLSVAADLSIARQLGGEQAERDLVAMGRVTGLPSPPGGRLGPAGINAAPASDVASSEDRCDRSSSLGPVDEDEPWSVTAFSDSSFSPQMHEHLRRFSCPVGWNPFLEPLEGSSPEGLFLEGGNDGHEGRTGGGVHASRPRIMGGSIGLALADASTRGADVGKEGGKEGGTEGGRERGKEGMKGGGDAAAGVSGVRHQKRVASLVLPREASHQGWQASPRDGLAHGHLSKSPQGRPLGRMSRNSLEEVRNSGSNGGGGSSNNNGGGSGGGGGRNNVSCEGGGDSSTSTDGGVGQPGGASDDSQQWHGQAHGAALERGADSSTCHRSGHAKADADNGAPPSRSTVPHDSIAKPASISGMPMGTSPKEGGVSGRGEVGVSGASPVQRGGGGIATLTPATRGLEGVQRGSHRAQPVDEGTDARDNYSQGSRDQGSTRSSPLPVVHELFAATMPPLDLWQGTGAVFVPPTSQERPLRSATEEALRSAAESSLARGEAEGRSLQRLQRGDEARQCSKMTEARPSPPGESPLEVGSDVDGSIGVRSGCSSVSPGHGGQDSLMKANSAGRSMLIQLPLPPLMAPGGRSPPLTDVSGRDSGAIVAPGGLWQGRGEAARGEGAEGCRGGSPPPGKQPGSSSPGKHGSGEHGHARMVRAGPAAVDSVAGTGARVTGRQDEEAQRARGDEPRTASEEEPRIASQEESRVASGGEGPRMARGDASLIASRGDAGIARMASGEGSRTWRGETRGPLDRGIGICGAEASTNMPATENREGGPRDLNRVIGADGQHVLNKPVDASGWPQDSGGLSGVDGPQGHVQVVGAYELPRLAGFARVDGLQVVGEVSSAGRPPHQEGGAGLDSAAGHRHMLWEQAQLALVGGAVGSAVQGGPVGREGIRAFSTEGRAPHRVEDPGTQQILGDRADKLEDPPTFSCDQSRQVVEGARPGVDMTATVAQNGPARGTTPLTPDGPAAGGTVPLPQNGTIPTSKTPASPSLGSERSGDSDTLISPFGIPVLPAFAIDGGGTTGAKRPDNPAPWSRWGGTWLMGDSSATIGATAGHYLRQLLPFAARAPRRSLGSASDDGGGVVGRKPRGGRFPWRPSGENGMHSVVNNPFYEHGSSAGKGRLSPSRRLGASRAPGRDFHIGGIGIHIGGGFGIGGGRGRAAPHDPAACRSIIRSSVVAKLMGDSSGSDSSSSSSSSCSEDENGDGDKQEQSRLDGRSGREGGNAQGAWNSPSADGGIRRTTSGVSGVKNSVGTGGSIARTTSGGLQQQQQQNHQLHQQPKGASATAAVLRAGARGIFGPGADRFAGRDAREGGGDAVADPLSTSHGSGGSHAMGPMEVDRGRESKGLDMVEPDKDVHVEISDTAGRKNSLGSNRHSHQGSTRNSHGSNRNSLDADKPSDGMSASEGPVVSSSHQEPEDASTPVPKGGPIATNGPVPAPKLKPILKRRGSSKVRIRSAVDDLIMEQEVRLESQKSLNLFAPSHPLRRLCIRVVTHRRYELCMLPLIILSTVCLALQAPQHPPGREAVQRFYDVMEIIFASFLATEFVAKVIAYGLWNTDCAYLRVPWNWLDILIVVSSLISVLPLTSDTLRGVKSVRMLRALWPLRVVTQNRGMRQVLSTLYLVLPEIANIVVVMLFVWLIFAILGVHLFKGEFYFCSDPDMTHISECAGYFLPPPGDSPGTPMNVTWGNSTIIVTPPYLPSGDYLYEYHNLTLPANVTLPACQDADPVLTTACVDGPHAFLRNETSGNVTILARRVWATVRPNFDNVFEALLTVFELATVENWPNDMYLGVDARSDTQSPKRDANPAYALYFLAFMVVGSLFIGNLFVSAIVSHYTRVKEAGANLFLTLEQSNWVSAQRFMLLERPERRLRPLRARGWRHAAYRLVSHPVFEPLIFLCILINVALLAAQHVEQPHWLDSVVDQFGNAFTAIFTLEAILKLAAYGWRSYISFSWNRLDFAVMILSLGGTIFALVKSDSMESSTTSSVRTVRFLRLFRLARILRIIKGTRDMRLFLSTFTLSLYSLANIGPVVGLTFVVFALLGMHLLGDLPLEGHHGGGIVGSARFDTFLNSLYTLFTMCTGEDWPIILHALMDRGKWVAIPFVIAFLVIIYFILLNLIIAVILDHFSDTATVAAGTLSQEHFSEFSALWEKYDPYGTLLIRAPDAVLLLRELSAPLGLAPPPPSRSRGAHRRSRSRLLSGQTGQDSPVTSRANSVSMPASPLSGPSSPTSPGGSVRDKFATLLHKADAMASGRAFSQLDHLVRKGRSSSLKPVPGLSPLQSKPAMQYLAELDVEVLADGRVHYLQLLHALAFRVCGSALPDLLEQRLRRQSFKAFPTLKQLKGEELMPLWKVYAIIRIQAMVRGWRARREFRIAAAAAVASGRKLKLPRFLLPDDYSSERPGSHVGENGRCT
eukprot:jgi/Mesvir1/15265/Mv06486-RA.2